MFLFLVDGNRDLDDPTDRTHAGLFRGFILRNSDVGAAALTLEVFLFRLVCGNHIMLGLSARGRLPAPARGVVDPMREWSSRRATFLHQLLVSRANGTAWRVR